MVVATTQMHPCHGDSGGDGGEDMMMVRRLRRLYLMRRSLEVLRKFHWMILGGQFNQLSHVSSPLFSKPGEYKDHVLDDSKSQDVGQNRRDLPRDIPLDSVVVLRYEKRSKSENKGKVRIEIKLVLEQTQQEHQSDTQVITVKMEILLEPTSNKLMVERFDTSAGNPVKEILLKLNLSDHKSILTDSKIEVKLVLSLENKGKRLEVFIEEKGKEDKVDEDVPDIKKGRSTSTSISIESIAYHTGAKKKIFDKKSVVEPHLISIDEYKDSKYDSEYTRIIKKMKVKRTTIEEESVASKRKIMGKTMTDVKKKNKKFDDVEESKSDMYSTKKDLKKKGKMVLLIDEDEELTDEDDREYLKSKKFSDIIFARKGLELEYLWFLSLYPGINVDATIIDAWSDVFNHEEKYRRNLSITSHVYCWTEMMPPYLVEDKNQVNERRRIFDENVAMILENSKKKNFNHVDLVFFSCKKDSNHHYIICFDMKNAEIDIIDNINNDVEDISERYGAYAMALVRHNHPSIFAIVNANPKQVPMTWKTSNNCVDSGVFVMRHMETYLGHEFWQEDVGYTVRMGFKPILLLWNKDMIYMKSSRDLGYTKQHFLFQASNANFGPSTGFRLLKQICGGFDRVGATVVDCKNQKKKMNLFIGDRDAQMAVEKLLSKKLHSPGFYVNYKLGDDDKLVGLFWADEQAIRDYAVFGDIVSFDATFRSNNWIPAFLRDELMACLIRTTSWSKSENHFFGKWTSPHLTLVEFLSHYDTAIEYQRYIERKNDHDSRYKNPKLKTDLQMEKEASTFYTRTVFFDVQDEIYASYSHCMSVNVVQVDNAEKYSIRDMQAENRIRGDNNFVVYQVDFCKSEMEIECSCKHYEAYGLLCRHIFYVLRMNNIKEFPRKYLNKRWLKNAKPFNVAVRRIVGGSYSILEKQMKDLLNKAKIDVPTVPKLNSKDVFSAMLGVKEPTSKTIGNPDQSSNKGTGVHSRWKSKAEIEKEAAKNSEKRRTCSNKY
ncbi:FAR1 DNA binding domain, zinc finger, SWIM-type, MULE transposase domain containing protein [Tanacetum coccineum]